jgi:hypothetical protein
MNWFEDTVEEEIIDYLFTLRLRVGTKSGVKVIERNVSPELVIDFELLEEQLATTPQMISFYNQLLADQSYLVEKLGRQIRTKEGQVWDSISKDLRSQGLDVRSTDLKKLTSADPMLSEMEDRYFKEKRKETKLKSVIQDLIRKFDALRSLSGFKRDERRST